MELLDADALVVASPARMKLAPADPVHKLVLVEEAVVVRVPAVEVGVASS